MHLKIPISKSQSFRLGLEFLENNESESVTQLDMASYGSL